MSRLTSKARETAHRPRTGTVPAMESQPRRPPHLGTTTAIRARRTRITLAPTTRTVTPTIGLPSYRTSEYLRIDAKKNTWRRKPINRYRLVALAPGVLDRKAVDT
jgi:hypothetical protein